MALTGIIIVTLVLILLTVIYALQDKLIFFPEKIAREYSFPFDDSFQEVFLKTPDNAELHALHFKTKAPVTKGVILYFHGNAGSLRSWGYLAPDLLLFGYDVFMVDYRGFGKSTGTRTEASLHQDAQLAYNYLLKHYPEDNIVIFGRSIGTGVAVPLAAQNHPKLLLLETPFYSFKDVAKTHYPFLPVAILLKYNFPSDKWIKKVPCPVFILHGTADSIVPYTSGQKLARLRPEPNVLITIKGGGHNDLSNYKEYWQHLKMILK